MRRLEKQPSKSIISWLPHSNQKKDGEAYVDKLNAKGKENFFLMNMPTQKIFRVCIAKGTKEKMQAKRLEILKEWDKAWLLEM
ncbi:MAG: hypothetical protein IPK03_16765 [Bacteroidetes bacterium]|nr:hypothetical protein [Bacteroidota bacterium]